MYVVNSASLGQRIRARRVALGLTLADVADRASLSLPYVSNLERGRGNPTIDALRSIAKALETSLSALVGEQAEADFDPLALVLSEAPKSLTAFARTRRFAEAAVRLADKEGTDVAAMRRRLLVAMASAPRRSHGEPTEEDWRRLLDVYALITTEE